VGRVFLFGIPLLALWGLAMPPIQSLMTQQVDPSEQGRLQGAIGSLGSFAGIFGPYLFAQIFALSIAPGSAIHLPGVAFLLSATLMLIGLVIAARATRGAGKSAAVAPPADPLPDVPPGDMPPFAALHPSSPPHPQTHPPLTHPPQETHP